MLKNLSEKKIIEVFYSLEQIYWGPLLKTLLLNKNIENIGGTKVNSKTTIYEYWGYNKQDVPRIATWLLKFTKNHNIKYKHYLPSCSIIDLVLLEIITNYNEESIKEKLLEDYMKKEERYFVNYFKNLVNYKFTRNKLQEKIYARRLLIVIQEYNFLNFCRERQERSSRILSELSSQLDKI